MPKDEEPSTDTIESLGRYLPQRITVPADKTEVTQYLEGSLALSVKDPPFLEPYVFAKGQERWSTNSLTTLRRLFQTFPQMDPTVQEVVQELLVRPIQAIGPNNPRLLEYLKNYPEGAETLVLKILNVFTEKTKPAPSIISLVKSLLADRGADARFLMFIISEMDKVMHFYYVNLYTC
jgi:symplekin